MKNKQTKSTCPKEYLTECTQITIYIICMVEKIIGFVLDINRSYYRNVFVHLTGNILHLELHVLQISFKNHVYVTYISEQELDFCNMDTWYLASL